MPLTLLSFVDNKSFESRSTSPVTKSRASRTVAGGQCRDAESRRFAKAAERHGGEAATEARGENASCNARKSISEVESGLETRMSAWNLVEGGVSICDMRLSEGIMPYNPLIKSLRSMSRASPNSIKWGQKVSKVRVAQIMRTSG